MRVLRFIVRNWPLKIGAVLLASILYVGMVLVQANQQWPGTVAIDTINQPSNGVLTEPNPVPEVGSIRYIAAPDVPISRSTFRATADLTNAKVSESESSWVRVQLVATDSRVTIIDYQPQQILVRLDPIVHKQVTVHVNTGAIPSGLQPGTPVLSASTVDVSGAASVVRRVAYVEATVRIDASGLDVDENPDLVARDVSDAVVEGVTIDPRTIHVQMQVGSNLRTESVPVKPNVTHSPAVSVRGQADALALLKGSASTKPIDISGATSDVSVQVSLDLPSGVTSDTTSITVVVHLQAETSTRSLTVGVVPVGARSDRIYTLSTPSVVVTLGGATAALNALDTSTLVANVSVGNLGVGTHTVQVTVTVPAGIKVVEISPLTITVTISVTASPAPSASAP
jgi:YbbR domain-containing protein